MLLKHACGRLPSCLRLVFFGLLSMCQVSHPISKAMVSLWPLIPQEQSLTSQHSEGPPWPHNPSVAAHTSPTCHPHKEPSRFPGILTTPLPTVLASRCLQHHRSPLTSALRGPLTSAPGCQRGSLSCLCGWDGDTAAGTSGVRETVRDARDSRTPPLRFAPVPPLKLALTRGICHVLRQVPKGL